MLIESIFVLSSSVDILGSNLIGRDLSTCSPNPLIASLFHQLVRSKMQYSHLPSSLAIKIDLCKFEALLP
jgi:hypothetical protein